MEELLDSIMELGEQMLVSGGEVHRVEDSIKRIFTAYSAKRIDVFIITSSMVVTVHSKSGEVFTQTRRINDTGTDFEKLHRLNELSRKICSEKLPASEIKRLLNDISSKKAYPLWLEFICYSVIAGSFTLFFGGGINDMLISLVIGAVIRLIILACDRIVRNKIFAKFLSAFIATLLAYPAFIFGIIPTVDKVIIGNIMTLIPGIGLTNALRDLLIGDSIAGMLRTIEACIAALAIAAGYFAVVFLTGGITI